MKQRVARRERQVRAIFGEGSIMKVRSIRIGALAAALAVVGASGLTACSSGSDEADPTMTTSVASPSTTTSAPLSSSAEPSEPPAATTSTSRSPSSPPSEPSSTLDPTPSTSGRGNGSGVEVTSTTYGGSGYEILVTTRPGAGFMFVPTAGTPSPCTIVQRKPKGILTTHLLHCDSERVEHANLEVTFAATPNDEPNVVPLVTTGS